MAEEQTQTVETQTPETVEEHASTPKPEPEKTVSIAEMELSGKELEEYRRKEAEAEKQSLLDKIAGLEKEQTKRELTDEAIKTLSSRKLPVNDRVLSFVVKDTAEGTLQAISDFESIISEIKSEYTQSEPPAVSTAFGGSKTQSSGDIFRNSRII